MIYLDYFSYYSIENCILKLLIWIVYACIVIPFAAIIYCCKCWWLFTWIMFSATLALFTITYTPFLYSFLYEFKYTNLKTDFEIASFTFGVTICAVCLLGHLLMFVLVCWFNKFKEVEKIWSWFGFVFLYFKWEIWASFYWPLVMLKFLV